MKTFSWASSAARARSGGGASRLRPGIAIVTGLFLKGAGMGELWPHALAHALIGAPSFAASWLIFRRQW